MAPHYFDSEPQAPSRAQTVDVVLDDLRLRLRTDRGVFSPDRLDPGTRVLLDAVPPPPDDGLLLDLGCGYGPVALTMAARAPGARVLGVDVNARAVALARANAADHRLYNVDFLVVGADGRPSPDDQPAAERAAGPFAAIWSNPPIRIGKTALHALLRHWIGLLAPGGSAHLVVHRHLGADSLQRRLAELLGDAGGCRRTASRGGYRLLRIDTR